MKEPTANKHTQQIKNLGSWLSESLLSFSREDAAHEQETEKSKKFKTQERDSSPRGRLTQGDLRCLQAARSPPCLVAPRCTMRTLGSVDAAWANMRCGAREQHMAVGLGQWLIIWQCRPAWGCTVIQNYCLMMSSAEKMPCHILISL